ncbi:MAG: hypothetical protein C0401_06140, partial [Anaerolinea sp.]|nr:hypothetical protein [Anaerolinea sp.]
KTMANFFMNGLSEGNRILCIVDKLTPHDIRGEIKNLGVDIDALENDFITLDNETAYTPNGNFDPNSVLTNIGVFSNQARGDGYSGLHVSGDMDWVLRSNISNSMLMEYETKVYDSMKLTPCTAICEYDARKFNGSLIMDILSVHPLMMVRGQVIRNPYFILPKDFMAQYNARKN